MLMRWNNHGFGGFAPGFWAVNDLQRDLGRLFQSFDDSRTFAAPGWQAAAGAEPKLKVSDTADELRVYAEVPGFRAEDIQVSFDDGVLEIRAQRSDAAPEGYVAQRRERGSSSFSRRLTLQVRVDGEKIEAELKNGILELRLPKQAEARPRSIAVKAT